MTLRKRDFTFRQLSSFVAAARSGSFALAADQLAISQPAISDHISALERHLGYALFARRRGTTPQLTPQGVEMLQRAESLLRTNKAMHTRERRSGGKVRIRVTAGPRWREVYLDPLLPRFYADHPDIEIELVPMLPIRDVPAMFEKGQLDLLCYTVGSMPDSLPNLRHVHDVPITIVASPDVAARVKSGAQSLDETPFLLPCNEPISEEWLGRTLNAAGITPRAPIRYFESPAVIQSMTESGTGASILMVERVAEAVAAGRLVQLDHELPPMKRILARAVQAPQRTELLERCLLEALRIAVPA
jgi:DNA-binding transcriptional LysR family regulator